MTPLEVITNVLDDLERDDLFSVAERKIYSAIQSAHAIDSFAQDLRQVEYPAADQLIYSGKTTLTPPAGFRKVWHIETRNSTGVIDPGFKDQRNLGSLRDYYGYTIPHTFSAVGHTNLNLTGVSANIETIVLDYLSFPLLEVEAGEMVCDSWILEEFPQIIEAYLMWYLAPVTQQTDVQQVAAANVGNFRRELLSINVNNLLGEPRT